MSPDDTTPPRESLSELGKAIGAALDREASARIATAVERHLATTRAQLLSAAQAGDILGVSEKTFRRAAESFARKLPARYLSGDARWLRSDVETFAANLTTVRPNKEAS